MALRERTMTADRQYLITACTTEVGRDILREAGLAAILDAPEKGDDNSTAIIARFIRQELARRYGF